MKLTVLLNNKPWIFRCC